jgi:serine/threonine-protein kinase
VVYKLLDQIRDEMPPDPRTVCEHPVPDALAELAMQCLQKDPGARPDTADSMIRVLRNDWLND